VGEVAVKLISLAGIVTENEMLILTMYLKKYLKVLENIKYFIKVVVDPMSYILHI